MIKRRTDAEKKAARKARQAKYTASPKGKAAKAKYNTSPKGKASRAKYNTSPKGKASRAKYRELQLYGVTTATLCRDQHGLCKLCNLELVGKHAIDHNHATNKVRGLVHSGCNTTITAFDKIDPTVRAGIPYFDNPTTGRMIPTTSPLYNHGRE